MKSGKYKNVFSYCSWSYSESECFLADKIIDWFMYIKNELKYKIHIIIITMRKYSKEYSAELFIRIYLI